MSEDAKPSERRRRITRAGRRRGRPVREPGDEEGFRSSTNGSDPPGSGTDSNSVADEDGLYGADLDGEFEDEALDEFEALGELDAQRSGTTPPSAGEDASMRGSRPSLPLVREPRPAPAVQGRAVTLDESIVFDADDSELEDEAPTFPQMRRPEFADDKAREAGAPVVVVARATIVGDRPPGSAGMPLNDGVRTQSPVPPPPRQSVRPAPPPEAEDGGLQLMDVDEAVFDSGRPPSRSPPPPPPPDPKLRAQTNSIPQTAARKPPPPPGPQPRVEERPRIRKPRQWWERFFSEDYLMTVLPPSAAQVAKQVDFIEASLGVSKGGTILDVGCGLGLHAIELTRRGYLVVALDLSLAMITHASEAAQQQKLRLSFVHADIREMEFDGAFDAAICMGTTFGFFEDEANKDVLARLYQALRPGGRLLLDVVNRDYVTRFQPNLVWFEGDTCVCMEESDFNYFNARLNVKRTMMREDGHQTTAEYSLRLYSLHELGTLMQQSGFRVLEVSGQEAIRGVFFGGNAPRILMLAERRPAGAPSRGMPPERHSGEVARPTSGAPGERTSAEFVKSARVGGSET